MLAHGGLIGAAGVSDASGLPDPWQATDIGSPGIAGTSGYADSTFTLEATGDDLGGTSDDFHFVYRAWSGNGVIVARVASLEDTGSTPMAGVMFRETLASDARFACIVQRPANLSFRRRTTVGGTPSTSTSASDTAPTWVRLTRSGTTFTADRSDDGVNWTAVGGGVSVAMGSDIYVGLVCSSNETSDICTATLDNVSVT